MKKKENYKKLFLSIVPRFWLTQLLINFRTIPYRTKSRYFIGTVLNVYYYKLISSNHTQIIIFINSGSDEYDEIFMYTRQVKSNEIIRLLSHLCLPMNFALFATENALWIHLFDEWLMQLNSECIEYADTIFK